VKYAMLMLFQSLSLIQMANDKIMVENGQSMRRIMKATRAEAKLSRVMALQSQVMAEGMRQDSISMKSVSLILFV